MWIDAELLGHCFVVVVTCALFRRNKNRELEVLLLQRSDQKEEGPGLWTIPGGKVGQEDFGAPIPLMRPPIFEDVLERAVIREVYEETGILLNLDHVTLPRNNNIVFLRSGGIGMPTLVLRYFALISSDVAVTVSEEASGYAWVSQGALSDYACIGNVREDVVKIMKELAASS